MKSRELSGNGLHTFVLVFAAGDEVTAELLDFARAKGLTGASFTGIGAFQQVRVGYWDFEQKDYRPIEINEQVEVLSLAGNVARDSKSEPRVHAHIVVGKSDGTAHGGHLLNGIVRPTLEIVLSEMPAELHRNSDPDTGLALLKL